MSYFADRLIAAIDAKRTPAVVALDPEWQRLPESLRAAAGRAAPALKGIDAFCRRVIELICPIVPAVKINSAYFECHGAEGVRLYFEMVQAARQAGLIVIGDVKRGDVGHTARRYAAAHLAGEGSPCAPDAVTVSGYFGRDGVEPFLDVARQTGRGIFVLVRTSNPTAADIQDLRTAAGTRWHQVVAASVAGWAREDGLIGATGYSAVGAVAATRDRRDAEALRAAMPNCILLVPGYGAQGGEAADFAPYFDSAGRGAIIAAGRSVIYAFDDAPGSDSAWERSVEDACRRFAADLGRVMG